MTSAVAAVEGVADSTLSPSESSLFLRVDCRWPLRWIDLRCPDEDPSTDELSASRRAFDALFLLPLRSSEPEAEEEEEVARDRAS